MPTNRNRNTDNNQANANSFFSAIIQASSASGNSDDGRQRIPLGRLSGSAGTISDIRNGSWIVTELQQAQQQIQRTLQTATTGEMRPSLDPAAAPFYLHPRQSTHADFMEEADAAMETSSPTAALLSPHTIQVARETAGVEGLIESYLREREEDEEEADETETEIDAFIQPSPGINPAASITNNTLPIQLQQVLRNASQLHASSVQHMRAQAAAARGVNPGGNPTLRNKIVYRLKCLYCSIPVCERAMRAILLADTKIELYSTDIPPKALKTMDEDRLTQGCNCRIRDTVCTGCGNVLGYHVSQPCDRCLDARNNGHFWMFYSEGVLPSERKDVDGSGPLFWASLTPMCEFVPASACHNRPGISGNSGGGGGQDTLCR